MNLSGSAAEQIWEARKEIAKVRKRLEMQRDLDGIDISNIVDTGRRRLRH